VIAWFLEFRVNELSPIGRFTRTAYLGEVAYLVMPAKTARAIAVKYNLWNDLHGTAFTSCYLGLSSLVSLVVDIVRMEALPITKTTLAAEASSLSRP
jgi:hypothetical protein